jgi:hypothetical protein
MIELVSLDHEDAVFWEEHCVLHGQLADEKSDVVL